MTIASRLNRLLLLLHAFSLVFLVGYLAEDVREFVEQQRAYRPNSMLTDQIYSYIEAHPNSYGQSFKAEPPAFLTAKSWFIVADANGAYRYGPIPSGFPMPEIYDLARLDAIGTLVIPQQGNERIVSLRRVGKRNLLIAAGETEGDYLYWFLTAFRWRLETMSPVIVTLFVLTFLAQLVVVGSIKRLFRPLSEVVQQANRLNPSQRGQRLPENGVPGEMLPLIRSVNAGLARLDQGYDDLSKAFAEGAHELVTPISILRLHAETLPKGFPRQQMLNDAERLAIITERVISLAKARLIPGETQRVDLCEMAMAVVEDRAPLAIADDQNLGVQVPSEPVIMLGDERALRSAIANLVDNALRYSGSGAQITVVVEPDCRVLVVDDGPGIPESARQLIFGVLERSRPSPPKHGLGLSSVQAIVELHGGAISVRDTAGGGTTFILEFPSSYTT